MDAQNLLRKFSTKLDAIKAVDMMIEYLQCDDHAKAADQFKQVRSEIDSFEDKDLAQRVLEYFNEVNETNYMNTIKIRTIISHLPRVTFDQFQSIILHKYETWGKDSKMKDYLRPATLFGSKNKFLTYLDDATNYWIQKHKQQ